MVAENTSFFELLDDCKKAFGDLTTELGIGEKIILLIEG